MRRPDDPMEAATTQWCTNDGVAAGKDQRLVDRGLRFAMVTTFYPPHHFGGDGAYVRRLTHALARRGHRVDVLHDVDAFRILNEGPEPEPLDEPPGVTVHPFESRAPGLSCLATQQLGLPLVHGRRIRALLEQPDIDVIHFHNVSLIGGPGVLAYGSAIKLYTAHEHWLVCPSHILWRHGREPCPGRECLRCVLRAKRPPQLWRRAGVMERASRHVDRFISPSRFSAGKHREFGFQAPMQVMPLFLPDGPARAGGQRSPSPSPARGSGVDERRPYFLFVGRLELIKGIQDVIPLFDDDAPADLLIAGTGGYESELRRLASDRRRVRFLGQITPEALRDLYAAALALIAPSRCYEVFPMVLLEAFRERTPVIARRLGPFPEVIEQSGAGLLFDSESELRSAIALLAHDDDLRARLGESGRRAFERYWSEEVVLEDYLRLIGELARNRGRERVAARLAEVSPAGRSAKLGPADRVEARTTAQSGTEGAVE
jgi:glycosyltransferase involved in cell wall biosynthesis